MNLITEGKKISLSAEQFKYLRRKWAVANRIAQLKAANPLVNEKLLEAIALKELRRAM